MSESEPTLEELAPVARPTPDATVPWLTPFRLEDGETATFRIASFALQVTRRGAEWRVLSATTGELAAQSVEVLLPDPAPRPLPFDRDSAHARFAFDRASDGLRLRPRLADRPVIIRPADPLYLLPGASVDVYVSTVLWVVLESAPAGVALVDRPAHRPSDTWFGASTREGELAYASRTSARLDPRDLPRRPHRATTRIRLTNAGRQPRSLARVLLPAPELELWRLPSGMLWTQTVDLTLGDGEEAPLRFRPGPPVPAELGSDVAAPEAAPAHPPEAPPPEPASAAPAVAAPPVLVAPPRRAAQKNLILRAMSAIF